MDEQLDNDNGGVRASTYREEMRCALRVRGPDNGGEMEVARKNSPAIAIDRRSENSIARRLDKITRSGSSRNQSPNFGEAAAMQNSREALSSFPT